VGLDYVDARSAKASARRSQAGRQGEAGILGRDAPMDRRIADGNHSNIGAERPEGLDPRIHERPERRMLGARVQIGDDEDAHAFRSAARRDPGREPSGATRPTSLAGRSGACRCGLPRHDHLPARVRRDGALDRGSRRDPDPAVPTAGGLWTRRLRRRVSTVDDLHGGVAGGPAAWRAHRRHSRLQSARPVLPVRSPGAAVGLELRLRPA